jgi:guanylate kinase
MADSGMVVVISAPSGAGKSTLTKELLRRHRRCSFSVSVTTRPKRPGEVNGHDYHFISREEFKKMIRRREFAEWAMVHRDYYGTSKRRLETMLRQGKIVLLDIDVQGGRQIRRHYPAAVMIFIMPPSFRQLRQRLLARRTESAKRMAQRLRDARVEIRQAPRYTYLVINDTVPQAVAELEAILLAESCRVARRKKIIAQYL